MSSSKLLSLKLPDRAQPAVQIVSFEKRSSVNVNNFWTLNPENPLGFPTRTRHVFTGFSVQRQVRGLHLRDGAERAVQSHCLRMAVTAFTLVRETGFLIDRRYAIAKFYVLVGLVAVRVAFRAASEKVEDIQYH